MGVGGLSFSIRAPCLDQSVRASKEALGMSISFAMRASIPPDVMIQELAGEAVLLNLKSERYFGLDEVGTCMWRSLTTSPTIQATYEKLLTEYEVEPDQLRRDLNDLLENLVANGLVEVAAN
jgi:hypothetical protein